MTHPALRTRLTELLGCDLPIVQTGMGWVSGPRLTAATSAAGGFGVLGAVTMELDELRAAIKETKERTDRPFGVNLRADQLDVRDRIDLLAQAGVRVASLHPGVTLDEVRAETGFEPAIPDEIEDTRAPTDEELHLIRDVLDPGGLRRREVPAS